MALPTLADCKSYLRVENTAEDALITQLLARAIALSQRRVGCPFAAVAKTVIDRAETEVFYSSGPTSLITPLTPFDASAGLTITDADGTALTLSGLLIDGQTGIIRYKDGVSHFENGPYTIVANVGLSTLPNYSTEIEPVISSAIVDFVADLYQRRSPGARTESAAGGVSRTWTPEGIPCRVADVLDSLRRPQ